MAKKAQKTNVMRILDREHIKYDVMSYEVDESDLSGEHAARMLDLDPEIMFKTLVLKGDKTGHIVACIPVEASLDLKALSHASGNKSAEMIHVRELPDITGYIRGGCSPIGMKKLFPTYIDESALKHDKIVLSAGHRGIQVVLAPGDLINIVSAEVCRLTVK